MAPKEKKIAEQHWNEYWSHGHLTSLPNVFSGNYDGSVYEFWEGVFEVLPDAARVLDVGSGNGAIAFIAHEISKKQDKHFNIHAVDQAKIYPKMANGQYLQDESNSSAIKFYSNTSAESTPFADGSFDAVTGQYAFEYTNISNCLKELHRIMRTDAQAVFVLHQMDSVILRAALAEIEQTRVVFGEVDLFNALGSYLRWAEKAKSVTRGKSKLAREFEIKRKALESAVSVLMEKKRLYANAHILDNARIMVMQLVNDKTHKLRSKLDYMEEYEGGLRRSSDRLNDLIAAASRTDLESINPLLKESGFRLLQFEPLYYKGNKLIGAKLRFDKAS